MQCPIQRQSIPWEPASSMLTEMAKLFADFAQEFKKSCKGFMVSPYRLRQNC
jgi:hypothetical protein